MTPEDLSKALNKELQGLSGMEKALVIIEASRKVYADQPELEWFLAADANSDLTELVWRVFARPKCPPQK